MMSTSDIIVKPLAITCAAVAVCTYLYTRSQASNEKKGVGKWEISQAVQKALAVQHQKYQVELQEAVRLAVAATQLEHAANAVAYEAATAKAKQSPTTVVPTGLHTELKPLSLPPGRVSTFSVKSTQAALKHLAGRHAADQHPPVTIAKSISGVRHLRMYSDGSSKETMAIGAACSEIFSGPVLGEILQPGVQLQQQVVQGYLTNSGAVEPLSIHTSAGINPALGEFIEALQAHLPESWGGANGDWMLSLQLDGASAVHTAYDMLLQLQHVRGNADIDTGRRMLAAVGARSYHGPGSTSFGHADPLHASRDGKRNQICYPVPAALDRDVGESEAQFFARCKSAFNTFLDTHGHEIAVLFVEPQWGSSVAAQPWPKDLLRDYVTLAKAKGILVCADEIMCGLGRHGQGKLFVSDAWNLDIDAVTFGKAVAGGAYPLSGVVFRTGAQEMEADGRKPFQSHTYAHGAQALPLMAATQVLKRLPSYFDHIRDVGTRVCEPALRKMESASGGMVKCHGQGLMWGGLFVIDDADIRKNAMTLFKESCDAHGVLPYFVPVGGFMITPPLDVPGHELAEALRRLELCVLETRSDRKSVV